MSDRTLANILYRCAKSLAAMLEKEYGFRSDRNVTRVTVVGPASTEQIFIVDEKVNS